MCQKSNHVFLFSCLVNIFNMAPMNSSALKDSVKIVKIEDLTLRSWTLFSTRSESIAYLAGRRPSIPQKTIETF